MSIALTEYRAQSSSRSNHRRAVATCRSWREPTASHSVTHPSATEPSATNLSATELSDLELLRAHARGDRYAFDTLVQRHRDRLWAVALRTMRDPEEAADALQDALISAFRAAGSFRGDSAVTTWLHRIVVNACLDRIRRRKARPTVPLPDQGPGEPVERRDHVAERDTAIVIEEALGQLPVDQRAAITLVDLQGYSVADSAMMLSVPEGTIKSRCARGRARLAVLLRPLREQSERRSD